MFFTSICHLSFFRNGHPLEYWTDDNPSKLEMGYAYTVSQWPLLLPLAIQSRVPLLVFAQNHATFFLGMNTDLGDFPV